MDLGLCVQTLRGVVFIAGGFGAASLTARLDSG